MNIDDLRLKPNTNYEATVSLSLSVSEGLISLLVTIRTDENGSVCEVSGPGDGLLAKQVDLDIWNVLVLTDLSTGEVTDLRLFDAGLSGDLKLAQMALKEGADVSLRIKQESTALHFAALHGHLEIVEFLVEHGAEVDPIDELGWTPLLLAANAGKEAVVRFLHERGARLKGILGGEEVEVTLDDSADIALLKAAHEGDLEGVRKAIAEGGNVTARSGDGWSCLLAAATSDVSLTRLLLDHGADPNVASNRGYTPLMRAAGHGNEEVVRLLLSSGADPRLRDCDGKTATTLAMEMGQTICAGLCNPDA